MKLETIYHGIITPDGDLICGHNSETAGLYSTANRAKSYKDKLAANAKNRMATSQKRLNENPLNGVENKNFEGWKKRLEEVEKYEIIPVKIVRA